MEKREYGEREKKEKKRRKGSVGGSWLCFLSFYVVTTDRIMH